MSTMPPNTRERLARTAGVARATLDVALVGCAISPIARKALLSALGELGWDPIIIAPQTTAADPLPAPARRAHRRKNLATSG
jgi:hypothetical protein